MAVELPLPKYVVFCASNVDWKSQLETVAAHGEPTMLVGANMSDEKFIDDWKVRFGFVSRLQENGKLLLWKPAG